MAIKRDHIDRNNVSDAPQDWERYARVLREHGQRHPGVEFTERLESGWSGRLAEHRRAHNRKWIAAPLATLAVAVAGFLIVSDTVLRNASMEPSVADDPVLPLAPDEAAPRFAAPEIPPIWTDTNLPLVEPPILPGMADPSVLGSWADSILHEPPVAGE